MRERGMIFNAEMVRAVLEGRKTQTRRMLSPRQLKMIDAAASIGECYPLESGHQHENSQSYYRECCPFGEVGDRLWVRETWSDVNHEGWAALAYRADGKVRCLNEDDGDESDPNCEKYKFANWYPDLISGKEGRWRPSIHMPRWASRITLEITGVRVERLQDISVQDVIAEGIMTTGEEMWGPKWWVDAPKAAINDALLKFSLVWSKIYGEESWQANPWVWVIEFKRVEGE